MNYLCDTNIVSELIRPQPDINVLTWSASIHPIILSVITIDEIYFGLVRRPNPHISEWFETFFTRRCQILPVITPIARKASQFRGELSKLG